MEQQHRLKLRLLPGRFAVCQLPPDAPIPKGLESEAPVSISRTAEELSVVCEESMAPPEARCEKGWRCLGIQGPFPFSAIGVLASIAVPLAEAGVSLFATSTFDTDYILVREPDLERAVAALLDAGHAVEKKP